MQRTKEILAGIGLEEARLEMFFMSGGQGAAFAEAASKMTDRIKRLGPNPLKENGS
jgi:coenzyme F420-reducing hydrogenase delta subunit